MDSNAAQLVYPGDVMIPISLLLSSTFKIWYSRRITEAIVTGYEIIISFIEESEFPSYSTQWKDDGLHEVTMMYPHPPNNKREDLNILKEAMVKKISID